MKFRSAGCHRAEKHSSQGLCVRPGSIRWCISISHYGVMQNARTLSPLSPGRTRSKARGGVGVGTWGWYLGGTLVVTSTAEPRLKPGAAHDILEQCL